MTVVIYRLAGAVISLALLLGPLTEASGQRTVPGQWLGDAGVSVPLAPGSPASGAWVRAGRYLAGSYWPRGTVCWAFTREATCSSGRITPPASGPRWGML